MKQGWTGGHYFGGLLIVIALLLVGESIYRLHSFMNNRSPGMAAWVVSQAEIEILRFTREVDLAVAGDESANVANRYELLLSRIPLLVKSDTPAFGPHEQDGIDLAARLQLDLDSIENQVKDVGPGRKDLADAINTKLDPYIPVLNGILKNKSYDIFVSIEAAIGMVIPHLWAAMGTMLLGLIVLFRAGRGTSAPAP